MKKYDKESILRQYEESGKIMYQATLEGDYKSNNRRLQNAASRINTALFVTKKQTTPHRIWYNRVD